MKTPGLLTAALLVAGCASQTRSTFTYAKISARPLRVDVLYPSMPPPRAGYPVIVSIHGGAWIFGNRRKDVFLRDFTGKGFAIASIDYRLSSEAKFPAQIDDAQRALDWLVTNSRHLRIDPNRIGLTGASAGGHLALLLGLRSGASTNPVRAICAFYPPTDLVEIVPPKNRGRADNPVAALLGGPVSQRADLAELASPVNIGTAQSPPVLLIHGDRDGLVPLAQSRLLHEELLSRHARSTLIVVEGRGHAFGLDEHTRPLVGKFFGKYLGN